MFVADDGFVEAVDALFVHDDGGVLLIARLEADGIAVVEEDLFEGGFVGIGHADKTIVPIFDTGGRGKNNDVALVVFRFHRVADHADGKGVGIVEVGAADVIVGPSGWITHVVKVHRIAGGDFVNNRYEFAGD